MSLCAGSHCMQCCGRGRRWRLSGSWGLANQRKWEWLAKWRVNWLEDEIDHETTDSGHCKHSCVGDQAQIPVPHGCNQGMLDLVQIVLAPDWWNIPCLFSSSRSSKDVTTNIPSNALLLHCSESGYLHSGKRSNVKKDFASNSLLTKKEQTFARDVRNVGYFCALFSITPVASGWYSGWYMIRFLNKKLECTTTKPFLLIVYATRRTQGEVVVVTINLVIT